MVTRHHPPTAEVTASSQCATEYDRYCDRTISLQYAGAYLVYLVGFSQLERGICTDWRVVIVNRHSSEFCFSNDRPMQSYMHSPRLM